MDTEKLEKFNEEVMWREEHAKNYWHPLFKYVEDVKVVFDIAIYDMFKRTKGQEWVSKPFEDRMKDTLQFMEEHYGVSSFDFNSVLMFIQDCVEGAYPSRYNGYKPTMELLQIFKPLHIVTYGDLVLFKYKNFIGLSDMGYGNDFFDLYDGLYRECRSVVIDIIKMQLALAPQKKFFNINENPENEQSKIIAMINSAKKVEFSDKLDGSNENFRWYEGTIIGFSSSALDRKESWRLDEGYRFIENDSNYQLMMKTFPDWTFMYEYISPKNQVVVYYPESKEGLYLFGMRNIYTGEEKTYEEVIKIANTFNVPSTVIFDTDINTLFNSLDDYTSNEKEGWVIRIVREDGTLFKAKLKVNDYVLMHKAISKIISPNAIILTIYEEKYDDFIAKVPLAYHEGVEKVKNTVTQYMSQMEKIIKHYIDKAKKECSEYSVTKNFVQWCKDNVNSKFLHYCIAEYKDKPYSFIKSQNGRMMKLHEIEDMLNFIQRNF